MPEFTLKIDQIGADLLAFQQYDKTLCRGYYLLRDNPAVRIVTRGGLIEDCVSYVLPVLAGFEECWGQWAANAHLKGRKTFVVTVFAGEVCHDPDVPTFSAWLQRNYLDAGAPFREAGSAYHTKTHPSRRDALNEETLRQLQRAWQEEQSHLWREFKDSLTPQQLELYNDHRRATGIIGKVRRWRDALRRGKPLRGKEITWPEGYDA